MSAAAQTLSGVVPYQLREFHPFESAGTRFVYLVPSGAIYALDELGRDVVDELSCRSCNSRRSGLASRQSHQRLAGIGAL